MSLCLKFSAYLWGIETVHNSEYVLHAPTVLSLPMRNWNPPIKSAKSVNISFSAYLWGIETIEKRVQATDAEKVLSLPMRNWNKDSTSRTISSSPVLSLPMRNWNPNATAAPCQPGRSQPTYEELKLKGIQPEYIVSFKFSAYLWGIETLTYLPPSFGQIEFSAYLWGIETDD